MTSIQSKIEPIGTALASIENLKVYHYFRFVNDAPYCIWQEDSGTGLDTDNHKGEQLITGTVDYFTKTEYDSNVDAIQEALNGVEGLWWELNSTQFEDETNLIHFEWRWRKY